MIQYDSFSSFVRRVNIRLVLGCNYQCWGLRSLSFIVSSQKLAYDILSKTKAFSMF